MFRRCENLFLTAIYNCFFRHFINERGFHIAHAQQILVEISLKFDSKSIMLYIYYAGAIEPSR